MLNLLIDKLERVRAERDGFKTQNRTLNNWFSRLERAYNKKHEVEEIKNYNGITSYYGLIQTKVNDLASFIGGRYFSNGRFSFALEPTFVPDLPSETKKLIADRVTINFLNTLINNDLSEEDIKEESGLLKKEVVDYLKNETKQLKKSILLEETAVANEELEQVKNQINDILNEDDFITPCLEFFRDLILYPYACLKLDYQADTVSCWQNCKLKEKQEIKPN